MTFRRKVINDIKKTLVDRGVTVSAYADSIGVSRSFASAVLGRPEKRMSQKSMNEIRKIEKDLTLIKQFSLLMLSNEQLDRLATLPERDQKNVIFCLTGEK